MSMAAKQPLVAKKRDPVKGHGTQGRKFPLCANHYQLKCPAGGYFYHYDVDMVYSKEHKGKGDAKPSAPVARDRGRAESSGAAGPKLPKAVKKRAMDIFRRMPENTGFLNGSGTAYDGEKSLYSTKEFKIQAEIGSYSQIVTLPKDEEGGEKMVKVTLQPCQPLQIAWNQLDPATPGRSPTMHIVILQCINTVFREAAMATNTNIAIRRSYFTRHLKPANSDMGQGREIWGGFYSSARLTEWKITLNLDKTNTVFYKYARLLDFLVQFFRMRAPPPTLTVPQRKEFEKEVKTLKVETNHGPSGIRRVRVAGLSAEPSDKLFFEADGQRTNVKDYFKKTYNITLKFPGLPCLKIGTKGNFMPIEVCTLLEQKCDRRMTPQQTADMVRACTQPAVKQRNDHNPGEDRKTIVKNIRDKVVNYDTDPTLKAFGISVDREMVKLEGRHLDPPKLTAKDNKAIDPNKNDGTFNPGNVHFSDPATLKNWVVFDNNQGRLVDDFMDLFLSMGKQKGMIIDPPKQKLAARLDWRNLDFEKAFRETQNNFGSEKLDLIMVFLDRDGYPEVKKAGDIAVGVITQVVNVAVCGKNMSKGPQGAAMYVSNLLLKVNAKLGGSNIQVAGFGGKANAALIGPEKAKLLLRFTEVPTIVFGADVTHPSPGEASSSPSVAAVVASWNRYFTKYSARVRAQGHRAEMMADLGEMFCELMIEFRKRNNDQKPRRIIFYRDGVSEGQFDTVLQEELNALQNACKRLEVGYQPQITYIIVGKRHHTRFFGQNQSEQIGKAGNVPAGTVVDRGIVHPTEMDYFLCSHGGIQGTSRPAHYNVLYDDADFSADEIETFSYYLTYCYARCNRSVSIPTPVYYAHHVAFRARHHLSDADGSDTASSLSAPSGGPSPRVAALNEKIKVHADIKDSLKRTQYWM